MLYRVRKIPPTKPPTWSTHAAKFTTELFMNLSQHRLHDASLLRSLSLVCGGCLSLQQQQHMPRNAVKRNIPDVSRMDLEGSRWVATKKAKAVRAAASRMLTITPCREKGSVQCDYVIHFLLHYTTHYPSLTYHKNHGIQQIHVQSAGNLYKCICIYCIYSGDW